MHSTFKIITLVAGCWLLATVSGCSFSASPDADTLRRAQIVGNENIQLKKQIETLKAEIADLEKQVEAAAEEKESYLQQYSETHKGLMMILLECQTKLDVYEQEN